MKKGGLAPKTNINVAKKKWKGPHEPTGGVYEIEVNLRASGDINVYVRIRGPEGRTIRFWQEVYDPSGRLVHGPDIKIWKK